MMTINRLAAVLLAMTLSMAASAQEGKVELKTVVEKEQRTTNQAGEAVVQLVAADKVVPGDTVIYTVTYTNVADQSVENVVITNPISAELEYVSGSAFAPGADVTFSVDNGQTFDALESLRVERDGEEVVASNTDLTHIRWTLRDALDPGSQGFARFRARLN